MALGMRLYDRKLAKRGIYAILARVEYDIRIAHVEEQNSDT